MGIHSTYLFTIDVCVYIRSFLLLSEFQSKYCHHHLLQLSPIFFKIARIAIAASSYDALT